MSGESLLMEIPADAFGETGRVDTFQVALKDEAIDSDNVQHTASEIATPNCGFHFCTYCDYRSKKKHGVTRHVRQCHNIEAQLPGYQCDKCGKIESEKRRLKAHIEVEHEGKRWICDSCGKQYKSQEALNSHKRVRHSNKSRFKCSLCSKTFMQKSMFFCHLSKHEGINLYSCNLCPKQFRCEKNLKVHKASCHRKGH